MTRFACRDLSSRAVTEASWGRRDAHVQSIATGRPRLQAIGARGALHLPLRFSAKPSPGAPWARGLLSVFWEWGYPDLPACGMAQGVAQYGPSSSTHAQDPREGPSLAGRTTGSFLGHSLVRLAREEAERSRQGTSRGAHDASHDDQGRQAGASPRSVLLSSLVQRGQAQARASSKGIRFGATRPRPAERQDGGHRGAQAGVTVRVFGRQGPTLARISVLDVPLQNGQLLAPFSLNIWEEDQGLAL